MVGLNTSPDSHHFHPDNSESNRKVLSCVDIADHRTGIHFHLNLNRKQIFFPEIIHLWIRSKANRVLTVAKEVETIRFCETGTSVLVQFVTSISTIHITVAHQPSIDTLVIADASETIYHIENTNIDKIVNDGAAKFIILGTLPFPHSLITALSDSGKHFVPSELSVKPSVHAHTQPFGVGILSDVHFK